MKKVLLTFISEMKGTDIAEKQMLGLKISEEKKLSVSRCMSYLKRYYLKAEKRGMFLYRYS